MNRANLRIVVLVTAGITALVHGILLSVQMGEPSLLFILNGIGYLLLVLGLVGLPESYLDREVRVGFPSRLLRLGASRTTVRVGLHYLFIAYTGLTILAWIPNGDRTLTAFATKLDELILIYALVAHLRATQTQPNSSTQNQAPGA
jgi:hypothetical protein